MPLKLGCFTISVASTGAPGATTPARFIDRITVKDGGALVFDLEASLSLATNPVLSFDFVPQPAGPVTVEVHDSDGGQWRQDFVHPSATN